MLILLIHCCQYNSDQLNCHTSNELARFQQGLTDHISQRKIPVPNQEY